MKNNEYNKVTVTNETSNPVEFVPTQRVETTFYSENKTTPYKDELNSRATNNDKIEEIGVRKNRKPSSIKKEDYKKIKQGTVHLSSTAGHMVVAATTISVAVVGTMVGLDVLTGLEDETAELATFTDSEIGLSYVRFNFVVANELLSYSSPSDGTSGDPVGDVEEDYSFAVFYTLENDFFYKNEEVVEYGPYEADEDFTEFYGYIDGLTPDTSYALTLTLSFGTYEEVEDESTGDWVEEFVIVASKHLARREFSTKPVPDAVVFTYLEPTYEGVVFEFNVLKSAVHYDDETESHDSVFADISDSTGTIDSIPIEALQVMDDYYVSGYGSFGELQPNTKYTISILAYAEGSSSYETIGMTTFRTPTFPDYVNFTLVDPSHNDVMVRFDLPKDIINYGTATELPVTAELTNTEGHYDSLLIESFRDEGGDTISGEAHFDGLTPSTSYTLTIKRTTETAYEPIGRVMFTTTESSIRFNGIEFSEYAHYTNHTFTATLDFVDDEDNPRFSNFTLIWRDNVGNQIDIFPLEAVTTAQTLVVSTSAGGTGFAYDLDGTFNYELQASDAWETGGPSTVTLTTGGPVTFTNADVTEFNGFTSENKFLVNSREGNSEMLIQFDYVDEQLIYYSFTITLECEGIDDTTGDPTTYQFISTVAATTKWQYAEFANVDPDSFKYFNELADGSTSFDLTIDVTYNDSTTDTGIYTDTITPKPCDEIAFYEGQFNTNQVSSSDYDMTIYLWYTYTYDLSFDSGYPRIVFVDRDNNEEFIYTFYPDDYPSSEPITFNLCQIYDFPSGYEMGTYNDAKNTYDGKYFNVYIRWKTSQPGTPSGGDEESVLIDEGFYFNFLD